jgi:hypothetical protein
VGGGPLRAIERWRSFVCDRTVEVLCARSNGGGPLRAASRGTASSAVTASAATASVVIGVVLYVVGYCLASNALALSIIPHATVYSVSRFITV